ncbi:hypothetical protein NW765_001041 [Fusarium oxysporum]|nr:hypothetical protein NW765_001041 [Fusarium oxysporum]
MELSIVQLLPTQKQFSSSIIFSIRLPALFDTKHKMGEFVNSEPDLGTIKPSFTSSSEPENPRSKSLIQALSLESHIEGGLLPPNRYKSYYHSFTVFIRSSLPRNSGSFGSCS